MANSHAQDKEHFRRRVQQKLVDRYSANDSDQPEEKSASNVQSAKKSPFSFQNIIWLFSAALVFYFSDFPSVLLYDMRIKTSWFWVGAIALIFHVSIASFLVFWLSFWKKIDSNDWETMYPKAVPLATASFIIGAICLSVALWPVWGILTPVILGILFMGIVVTVAMFG